MASCSLDVICSHPAYRWGVGVGSLASAFNVDITALRTLSPTEATQRPPSTATGTRTGRAWFCHLARARAWQGLTSVGRPACGGHVGRANSQPAAVSSGQMTVLRDFVQLEPGACTRHPGAPVALQVSLRVSCIPRRAWGTPSQALGDHEPQDA